MTNKKHQGLWVTKIVEKLLKFKWLIIISLSIFFLYCLIIFQKNLTNTDNSLSVWLNHSDPLYVNYQKFIKEFGHDRMIALAFEVPNVFGREELQFVKNLSDALNKLPDVEKVESVTEFQNIETKGDTIEILGLFHDIPSDPQEIERRKKIALNDINMEGVFFNKELTVTTLLLSISANDKVSDSQRVVDQVKKVIATHNTKNYPVKMAGPPITDTAFNRLSARDQTLFLPGIFIIIFIVIYFFFRSFVIALFPLMLLIFCVVVTSALFFMGGGINNIVTGMLGPILVAVCVADAVHAMLTYYEYRSEGKSRNDALLAMPKALYRPVFFTALTTFAGFISFNFSPVVPNQILGQYTAMGVMMAYVLTIFFIPLMLSFLTEKPQSVKMVVEDGFVQKGLSYAFNLVTNHSKMVAFIFIAATILAVAGISKIKIETNAIKYFPEGEPERVAVDFFNDRMSGIGSFQLVLESRDPRHEIAKDPVLLKKIEEYREITLKDDITNKIFTYNDLIKKLNRAFHDNDESFYVIPDTQAEIAQLLLIAESSGDHELNDYKNIDNTRIRLNIKCDWRSSEEMNAYVKKFEERAKKIFEPLGVNAIMTGNIVLWVKVDDNLLTAEITSFSTALLMVSLMMMLVLRNVKAGLISMIPNALPILFGMGVMGFLGVSLNVATVMTSSIAIGITVDDSIHYLIRFKKALQELKDYKLAIKETNKSVGTAVIFTTTVLVLGFGMLSFSNFNPSQSFGALSALTLFLSIFCEIFLMPLLLIWLKPFKVEQ